MADMTPQEACVEAARIIERDGWHQGNYYKEPEGDDFFSPRAQVAAKAAAKAAAPVCALGAINRAVSGNAAYSRPIALQARELLSKHIGTPNGRAFPYIPEWNDDPARSAEDVILALKHASQLP
ncbi:hypothetical protein ACFWPU_00685 [Streptomyces sp. NPDC058471]|uniref:DUF6197 family protein n=1 Tax=Streptomyces sp. NPDC058471 TaxID=3346516 RepID=UPI003649E3F3